MKTLLIGLSLLFTVVACNKTPSTEYNEQRMEAGEEYREEMKDVQEDKAEVIQKRNERVNDARKELREEQNY